MEYEVVKEPFTLHGTRYRRGETFDSRLLPAGRVLELELQRKIRPAAGEERAALSEQQSPSTRMRARARA